MKKTILMSLFLGLFIFSCSDIKDINDSVKKINEDQSLILKKLSNLEKKISNLNIAPPNKNDKKKPPQSDPNKVYDVAEAGSVVLGNPNAAVTIIEWTDFQ
jgi:protein-disulfide isomerase